MRYVWASALALGGSLWLGTPAVAQSAFDGSWSVQLRTESGPCDPAYRYPITIEGGQVRYAGTAGFDVSGRVDAKGTVNVSVGSGQDRANAAGRLKGAAGTGKWTAPSRECSGRWRAEKRG